MTAQEFLNWEAEQSIRYEYLNGEAVAMAGGTPAHNQIATNLAEMLRIRLRGKGCKIAKGDTKVAISDHGPFHYADVSVTRVPRDQFARQYIRYPCLVVEVLSRTTEAIDRGEKFRQYRRIDTLHEYVLIDPDRLSVECFRLNERGNWELIHWFADSMEAAVDCEIDLASVGVKFSLSLLYEDIDPIFLSDFPT